MPDQHITSGVPVVSVVVPVFNEEDCLEALHRRLTLALVAVVGDYEIVFVNDGSRDRSLTILRGLAAVDPKVSYLSLSRNFGHEAATSCGLAHARGQAVVLMDADLQDPPELIPRMITHWREGFDVIYGQRQSRAGETWFTRLTSHWFYRVYRRLSPTPIPVDTGDFRLMSRAAVDAFLKMNERARFVRGMLNWTGFKQKALLYHRDPRFAGTTKYRVWNRLNLAVDAIAAATTRPLRWIGALGLALGMLCLCMAVVFVSASMMGTTISSSAWLALAIFFTSSVQLSAMGIIAEYVGRTHTETQGRPLYIVAEQSPRREVFTAPNQHVRASAA
jgi:dolichol-phosphate mannosyltransferase